MSTKLKKQIASNNKIEKIPLFPFLPSDNESSEQLLEEDSIGKNVNHCKTLLSSSFFEFLSQISNNDYTTDFFQTYLTYRSKPYTLAAVELESLSLLDKQVYMSFLRLAVPAQEYLQLPSQYPQPQLTVVKNGKSATPNIEADQAALLSQYKDYVSNLELVQFPSLLDLVSILSEANASASGKLLSGMFAVRGPQLNKEFVECINETYTATCQLVEMTVQLFHRVCDKQSPTKNKSVTTSKKDSGATKSPVDELYFIAAFMVDIVYSYYCWINAVIEGMGAASEHIGLFLGSDGTTVTSKLGCTFIDIMKMVYDVVLPLTHKVFKKIALEGSTGSGTTTDQAKAAKQWRTIAHYAVVSRNKSLELLDLLVSASLTRYDISSSATTEAAVSDNGEESQVAVADLDSVSWTDVLQSKIDVNGLLKKLAADQKMAEQRANEADDKPKPTAVIFGYTPATAQVELTVEDTDLMGGALVSDYIRYCDMQIMDQQQQQQQQSASSSSSSSNSSSNDNATVRNENKIYTMLCNVLRAEGSGVDCDRVDYLLASLRCNDTLLVQPSAAVSNDNTATGAGTQQTQASSSNSGSSSSSSSSQQSAADTALINGYEAVKTIFPDLGDGFIEACLKVYNNNAEQVIDALLSENLDPRLSLLDKKMQRMWSGKNSNSDVKTEKYIAGSASKSSTNTAPGGLGVLAKLAADKEATEYKNILKTRLAAEEKQREYDAYIVEKENSATLAAYEAAQNAKEKSIALERSDDAYTSAALDRVKMIDYADDYDDQYDDFIPSSKQAEAFKKTTPSAVFSEYEDEDDTSDGDDRNTKSYSKNSSSGDARNISGYKNGRPVFESAGSGPSAAKASVHQTTASAVTVATTNEKVISAASAKRKEKKAAAKATSSNSSKLYTEDSRAEMLQNMAETRRFNTLLKDDENEAAFWESMKNTNHKPATGGGRDSWKRELAAEAEAAEGEIDTSAASLQRLSVNSRASQLDGAAAPQMGKSQSAPGGARPAQQQQTKAQQQQGSKQQSQSQQPKAGGSKTDGAAGPSADGTANKKHSSKKFDKHHQQDKANRKFGSFMPNV